jgi:2-polyprenyl-3-methyl-5-hydroxy-6-metoxy-1,4-benzoquinol methylase
MATSDAYFDQVWTADDPWEQATRFSEHRKYAITVASLLRPRYRRAFEPACATGLLTELLASRADALVATDRHPRAVALTSRRLAGQDHVSVRLGRLPDDVPPGPFDLVVYSEVLYYLDQPGVSRALQRAAEIATPDAHLVVVHYRQYVADHALLGDEVHELLEQDPHWRILLRHDEADFRLDVCGRA